MSSYLDLGAPAPEESDPAMVFDQAGEDPDEGVRAAGDSRD
jgi:hypothetical protein